MMTEESPHFMSELSQRDEKLSSWIGADIDSNEVEPAEEDPSNDER